VEKGTVAPFGSRMVTKADSWFSTGKAVGKSGESVVPATTASPEGVIAMSDTLSAQLPPSRVE
jgi:hypothetical protein